ncbi:MAG: hypothetical protein PVG75_09825 [Thioalkalispiraceae bacterium]|jgi:hypothetical protein
MRKFKLGLIFLIPLMLIGCGGTMITAPSQQLKAPPTGKATIVFMRTSFVAGAIGAEVFETTGGELKFVGNLAMGTKITYETTPGEKVFMTYGTAADFMKANVSAGKTYYVIARPNWGTGGFAPTPIRGDNSSKYNVHTADFKSWVADTELMIPGPESQAWFKENKARMKEIYQEYWQRFQTKTPAEIAERTLNPRDGQ